MVDVVTFQKQRITPYLLKWSRNSQLIGAIGLACALNYVSATGLRTLHNMNRSSWHMYPFASWSGLRHVFGQAKTKAQYCPLISGVHHYDAGMIMDRWCAVRTGTHCPAGNAALWHWRTIRASLRMYNTLMNLFIGPAIQKVKTMFD